MSSPVPATAILPIDLGAAAAYDQNIFPLAYYEADGNFDKGVILISATLEEMARIRDLGVDLNGNADFIFDTRRGLEALERQKAKLQNKTLNPFKALMNYRAARLFHAAATKMFLETRRTSERIHRDAWPTRVVQNTQVRMVDGNHLPPGAVIMGIAVNLPDGYNEAARQTINGATETIATSNPFQDDPHIAQRHEDEYSINPIESVLSLDVGGSGVVGVNRTSVASSDLQRSCPTGPIQNHYHIYNSIVATNSNLTAPAVSQGSHLGGSSVTQQISP